MTDLTIIICIFTVYCSSAPFYTDGGVLVQTKTQFEDCKLVLTLIILLYFVYRIMALFQTLNRSFVEVYTFPICYPPPAGIHKHNYGGWGV